MFQNHKIKISLSISFTDTNTCKVTMCLFAGDNTCKSTSADCFHFAQCRNDGKGIDSKLYYHPTAHTPHAELTNRFLTHFPLLLSMQNGRLPLVAIVVK